MTVCMYRDIHTLQPYITNICGCDIAHNSVMGFLQGHFLCCGTTAQLGVRSPRLEISESHTHTHTHTHTVGLL